MGIFDRAARDTKRGMAPESKSDVRWDSSRGWNVIVGKESDDLPDDFTEYVREGHRRNAVVAACVREIQTSLSEAPILAYRRDEEGDFVRQPDHPAEQLLDKPNGKDSRVEFMERLTQHFLLGGNAYIRKRRAGSELPRKLLTIRPDRVRSVDVDGDGIPVSWEVAEDELARTTTVSARNIVHIPDTDPLNDVFGMPRIMSAVLDVATDNEASNYVHEMLGNHGSPGVVVSIDADKVRNAALLERSEERWEEKFGPGRGRGKVAFLPGAQQVQKIGFNLRDLEFEALRGITREDIASSFGVDPRLIGIGSAAKGSSLAGNEFAEARRKLWTQTVIPMIRRFEGALNAFLAPEWGGIVLRFDLAQVRALKEDRNDRVDRAKGMVETGAATLREVRAEMGLNPDPAEDGIIVRMGNVTYHPVGGPMPTAMNEEGEGEEGEDGGEEPSDEDALPAPTDVKPLPEPTSEEDEGEFIDRCMGDDTMVEDFPEEDQRRAVCQDIWDDEEETDSLLRLLDTSLEMWENKARAPGTYKAERGDAVTPTGYVIPGEDLDDKSVRVEAWKAFDEFARAQEPVYRMAADRIFDIQRRELPQMALSFLEEDVNRSGGGPAETKGITPESLDAFERRLGDRFDEYHRRWRMRYDALMRRTTEVTAGLLSGATGLSFDVFNPAVLDMIQERQNLIVDMDRATFRAVRGIVRDGFTEGEDIRQVARRIQGVFDQGVSVGTPGVNERFLSAQERSRLIARTETTAIANGASNRLMGQSDVPWFKMWLSQGDDRVRDEHVAEEDDSHDEPVAADKAFRVTGLEFPQEPRCILGPRSQVWTKEGRCAISEIEEGVEVLTHRGRYRRVLKVHQGYHQGEAIRLWIRAGRPLTVTPEHPILTEEGWKEARDLTGEDRIIIQAHFCPVCGEKTPFWRETCSKSCSAKLQWQDPEVREKMRSAIGSRAAEVWAEKGGDSEWREQVLGPAHAKTRELVAQEDHAFQKWWRENPEKMKEMARENGKLGGQPPGSDHPSWVDGRARERYEEARCTSPGSWHKNRALALERDNYACRNCGIGKTHAELEVHHITKIQSPEGTNYLDNLVTLCRGCHNLLEEKEEHCRKLLSGVVVAGPTPTAGVQFMPWLLHDLEVSDPKQGHGQGRMRWNLTVEDDETFVVAGVVSHNCRCSLIWSQEDESRTPGDTGEVVV